MTRPGAPDRPRPPGGELELLAHDDLDDVLEATRLAFAPKRSPAAHRDFILRQLTSPWSSQKWLFPALRDEAGRVVASLSLFDLTFRLDERRLRVGGIGAVVVREDARRRGLGRALMRRTEDWARAEGYDAMLLFSAIGAPYYERLGYEVLPLHRLTCDLSTWVEPPPTASRVRPFEEHDLAAVRELHARDAALRRFCLLRDEGYWEMELLGGRLVEELLDPPPLPARWLVGERDGRVVSHARFARSAAGDLFLQELGFEPGAREDLGAMLGWLLERIEGARPAALRGVLPSRVANLVPVRDLRWEPQDGSIMMMKSLGDVEIPVGLEQDERLAWPSDWF